MTLATELGKVEMIDCHSCHAEFEDYRELALHISSSRKGHRQGKKWAAKYLFKNMIRRDLPQRIPNMQEKTKLGDENRENSKREISGDNEYTTTLCPQCKKPHRQLIPVEHINNDSAWRKNGILCVICEGCRG